ncbi:AMP-binding protein, partial [Rhizobium johnstonii]|uniref:AMP-binding protein n=1 Tax=Rhizobium johnstonii TaxID=3019933 RepID=UPI003F97014F
IISRSAFAPAPRTLVDILRATVAGHPEASAIEDVHGALSYRELMARAIAVAARLHAAGVRRGDRVGALLRVVGVDGNIGRTGDQ